MAAAAKALFDQLVAIADSHVPGDPRCATCEAIRDALTLSVVLLWCTDP